MVHRINAQCVVHHTDIQSIVHDAARPEIYASSGALVINQLAQCGAAWTRLHSSDSAEALQADEPTSGRSRERAIEISKDLLKYSYVFGQKNEQRGLCEKYGLPWVLRTNFNLPQRLNLDSARGQGKGERAIDGSVGWRENGRSLQRSSEENGNAVARDSATATAHLTSFALAVL